MTVCLGVGFGLSPVLHCYVHVAVREPVHVTTTPVTPIAHVPFIRATHACAECMPHSRTLPCLCFACSCGACWANTAASALESAYLISQGLTTQRSPEFILSEQQLYDCADRRYYGGGCDGGGSEMAFNCES